MPNTYSTTKARPFPVQHLIPFTALLLAGFLLAGCREPKPDRPAEVPAREQPPDSIVSPPTPVAPNIPSDTTAAAVADPTAQTAAAPAHTGPAWNRAELVAGTRRFIEAIDSNNEVRFWRSLSRRSIRMIDQGKLGPREKIWAAAQQALGDIEGRRITVLGGSHDSVALRIDGRRLVDGQREEDPVIIHLLREGTTWKVIYPGLLYPQHDMVKGR